MINFSTVNYNSLDHFLFLVRGIFKQHWPYLAFFLAAFYAVSLIAPDLDTRLMSSEPDTFMSGLKDFALVQALLLLPQSLLMLLIVHYICEDEKMAGHFSPNDVLVFLLAFSLIYIGLLLGSALIIPSLLIWIVTLTVPLLIISDNKPLLVSFKHSFRASYGFIWRFFLAVLPVFLILFVIFIGLGMMLAKLDMPLLMIFYNALLVIITLMISGSYMIEIYQTMPYFAERKHLQDR